MNGSTSGEHLAEWLWARAGHLRGYRQRQAIAWSLMELVQEPKRVTCANLLLATPDHFYAFRFAPPGLEAHGLYELRRERTLIVATDPLSPQEPWKLIENGTLVVADRKLRRHDSAA